MSVANLEKAVHAVKLCGVTTIAAGLECPVFFVAHDKQKSQSRKHINIKINSQSHTPATLCDVKNSEAVIFMPL